MALISFRPSTPTNATTTNNNNNNNNKKQQQQQQQQKEKEKEKEKEKDHKSWEHFMNLLSCKNTAPQVHNPSSFSSSSPSPSPSSYSSSSASSKYVKLSSTCGSSICSFRAVEYGNTHVVDNASNVSSDVGGMSGSGSRHQSSRKATAAAAAAAEEKDSTPLTRSACGGGMQLRKLSGCYECRAINAEPATRYPRPRTLCPCTYCREVFTKPESLEHHQALRHAVSELGPDDSGRNIVEIIFKSSWQKKDSPICKIERILKVHTAPRTAARFEDYRDSVRSRALLPRRNPRCAADGNELLRFHCTSLSCPLGANSSTFLCLSSSSSSSSSSSNPQCDVCTIIRYGFSRAPSAAPRGIRTTASSGRAHDCGPRDHGAGVARIRAMLVCRVIAGRVKRAGMEEEEKEKEEGLFDSVAGQGVVGSYGNLEELFVANPRAILPCFVVIYRTID